MRVLAETYGFKIQAAVSSKALHPAGAIPFVEVDDLRGRRIVSLPFSDYCDPLVGDQAEWERLLPLILRLNAPVKFRGLRAQFVSSDHRLTQTGSALWHGVDLLRPNDEVWANLGNNARQNIRKAQKSGIKIREGRSLNDIMKFYKMHSLLRKIKYRMFAQPIRFFEIMYSIFSADSRIFTLIAEQDSVPIAGILFLINDDTLYYKFNASIDTSLRPNDLLVWAGITAGQAFGLKRLDFGVSDLQQPGLVRFKRKFATEEQTVFHMNWFPNEHSDPRADEAGRLLGQLTSTLTSAETDLRITQAVGDLVYRYFC